METMNGQNLFEICHVCTENDEELLEFKPLWYEIYHNFIGVFEENSNNLPYNICKKCKSYLESMVSFANKCKTNDIRLEESVNPSRDLRIKKNCHRICRICLEHVGIINECPPNLYELYKNLIKKKSSNDVVVLNLCAECKSYLQLIMSVISKWKLNKSVLEKSSYSIPEHVLQKSDLEMRKKNTEIEYNDLMKQEVAEACMTLVKIMQAEDESRINAGKEHILNIQQAQYLELSDKACYKNGEENVENGNFLSSNLDFENNLQNTEMPKEFNVKYIEKDDNEVKSNPFMKESEKPENKNNSRKSQKRTYLEKPQNRYNLRSRDLIYQQQLTAITMCEHCQKPISSKRGFTKHVACIIREENQFECFICGKFLASKSSLITHDKRLHKRLKRD